MDLRHSSQWLLGNITVAQTLVHRISGLETAMGVIDPKRAPFPANVMGLLVKPLVFGQAHASQFTLVAGALFCGLHRAVLGARTRPTHGFGSIASPIKEQRAAPSTHTLSLFHSNQSGLFSGGFRPN